MKVRTALLFACMVIVPGLAMFSHRVPPEVRTATRCALWDPMLAWVEGWSRPAVGEDDRSAGGTPREVGPATVTAAEPPRSPVHDSGGVNWDGSIATAPAAADATERLVGLGASAIECRSLDPTVGTHVASCRIAMDSSGQLHRVFQAAGPSPGQAVSSLADQVESWRARLAARAGM
jgi:hypothetical protein